MSDPVSNADIEDVLSSIRRLVSVDERADRRATGEGKKAAPPSQETQTNSGPGQGGTTEPRLVLTPSFKVRPEDDAAPDKAAAAAPDGERLTLDQWQIAQDGDDAEDVLQAGETPSDDDRDDTAVEDGQDALAAGEARDQDDAPDYDAAEDGLDEASWEDAVGDDAPGDFPQTHSNEYATSDFGDSPEDDAELREWLEAENARNGPPEDWQDAEGDAEAMSDAEGEDAYGGGEASFDAQSDEAFVFVDFSDDTDDDYDNDMDQPEPVTSELEARIAEVEAAVAARQDQWEPDGASQDAYAGGRTEPLPWEDHVDPSETQGAARDIADAEEAEETAAEASEAGIAEQVEEAEVVGEAEHAEDATAAQVEDDEADAVSEVEDAATPDAPAPEPDSADDRTLAGVSAALAGSVRGETETEADETGLTPEAQERASARFSEDATPQSSERQESWYREDTDAVLDEDALRDLVSEIVRRELQGTLGERITRNVRKLVRREIHRAMMGQDLD